MASWKMTEHLVSQAIEWLYELLLRGEASPDLSELGAELKEIRHRLISLSSRLTDSDEDWLATLTQLAGQVCDVAELELSSPPSFLVKALRFHGNGLRAQIKSFRRRIKEIVPRGSGLSDGSEAEIGRPGRGIDATGDSVVGLESSVDELMEILMKNEADQVRCVSIVGMGGIGKTTLAKELFWRREVRLHFDCCVWVYLSTGFKPRDFLYEVLVQVGFRGRYKSEKGIGKSDGHRHTELLEGNKKEREVLKDWGDDVLVEFVRKELEDKQFLMVVDDIWDLDVWDTVKHAFSNGRKGSKIMFTTRIIDIAHRIGSYVCQATPLSSEDSLRLLARKAFNQDQGIPLEIEHLLRVIVDRYCRGTPLLIILLGGLLRSKRSLSGWEDVCHYLSNRLWQRDRDNWIIIILTLCYNDLPCYLTPCFLYFACLPENFEIPKRKLIRLWIAEGFIPKPRRKGQTMEDIAEGYLCELINRCMVMVVKRDHTELNVKTCKVHDLILDFCKLTAQNSNFNSFRISLPGKVGSDNSINTKLLEIKVDDASDLGSRQDYRPKTRSLLWFATTNPLLALEPCSKKDFRLLRVLELGFISNKSYGDKPTKLPRGLGNLVNLRYLGLRNVLISELPSTIGNLRYLDTIDLRGNQLQSLPNTISRLTCLRHLLLPALQSYVPDIPNRNTSLLRMDKLKNLQTLKFIEAMTLIRCDAVLRLTNIRNLKIEFKSRQEVRAVLASPIVGQNQLQSLHMFLLSKDTFPSLESLSGCYGLHKLGLHGTLNEEDLQYLPKNLSKLLFSKSNMKQDPMVILQKMTNLRFLRLGRNSYMGTEMACCAGGFSNLDTLQLVGLSKLQRWQLERGSMPKLTTLDIENTPMTLPEEVKFLPSLKDLNITDLRETTDETVEEDGPRLENLDRVDRFKPSTSFSLNVENIPSSIAVHFIIAEISSAVGC